MSADGIAAGPRITAVSTEHSSLLDFGLTPEPWREQALCREVDLELHFPEKGGSTKDAKRTCARCPVRVECLNYALDHDERFGVWGGLSERERRQILRQRRQAAS